MSFKKSLKLAVLCLSLLGSAAAHASQSITIQGRVADSNGVPVTGATTQFQVKILAPNAARCVLYDETQTLNLSQSNGLFSINLNSGAGTINLPTTYQLESAISNRASFAINSSYCQSGSGTVTYSPSFNDNRKVIILFRDPGSMATFETIPEMDLNPVPYAIESRGIGGFPASSLLRVANAGVPGVTSDLSSTQFSELLNVLAGTSNNYMSSSGAAATGARLPNYAGDPASPAQGSMWFDTSGSGAIKYKDSTGTIQTLGTGGGGGSGDIDGVTAGTGLSGGGTSGTVTVSLATSGVTAAAYGSASAVPVITVDAYGRLTSATTAAITGTLPSGTSGQFLKSGGGSTWVGASILMADLKSTIGGAALFSSPGCTAAQTLYWDSGTDQIKCQTIGIAASQITSGTIADARLSDVATAGTYKSVAVDTKGRVTAGTNPTSLSGFGITDGVQNTSGVPSMSAGVDGSLPAAGTAGRIYFATDTFKIYRDNGTTWDVLSSAAGSGGDITEVAAGTGLSGGATSGVATISMPATGTAGTYKSVTTDAQGRVTAGTNPTTLSGFGISNAVENGAGVPSFTAGTFAARPAFGTAGRIYVATDTNAIYRDTGAAWNELGPAGAAGDITDVVAGTGLSGGASSGSATVNLANTAVTAAAYGSATQVSSFTVDAQGRLTAAANVAITGLLPSGTTGQFLKSDGTVWSSQKILMADLKSSIGPNDLFSSPGCTAAQSLYWDSGTDQLKCQAIAIAATQITGTISNGNLPGSATAWAPATGGINYAGGNVGIGTAAPTEALQVRGDINVANGGNAANAGGSLSFSAGANSNYSAMSSIKGILTNQAGTEQQGGIAFQTRGYNAGASGQLLAERMRISENGNVGIGTTAPAGNAGTVIHIYNSASTGTVASNATGLVESLTRNANFQSRIPAAGTSGFQSYSNDAATLYGQIAFSANSGNPFAMIYTGASERLRIDSAGNVGIGTTAPRAGLEVTTLGNASALILPRDTVANRPTAGVNGMIRYASDTNVLEAYVNGAWATLGTLGGTQSFAGNVSVGGTFTSTGAASLNGGATISGGALAMSSQNITGVGSNLTGASGLTVAAGGSNQNLTLQSTGTGAVNLGSSNGASLSVLDGGASTVNYMTIKGAAAGASPVVGTAGSDSNINLTFTPKGTGASVFNGNVGVGTTTPYAKLHVRATELAPSLSGNNEITQISGTAAGAQALAIGADSSSPYGIWLQTKRVTNDGSSWPLSLNPLGGNVGIGTTAPLTKLHVTTSGANSVNTIATFQDSATAGTAYQSRISVSGATYSMDIGSTDASTIHFGGAPGNFIATGASQPFFIAQSGTPRVYINSSGSVGIGTTSPTNKLSVMDSTAALASIWGANSNASGIGAMGYNSSTGAYGQLGAGAYAGLFMNGNVGIGTTNPQSRLDNIGSYIARGLDTPTSGKYTRTGFDTVNDWGEVLAYDSTATAFKSLVLRGARVNASGTSYGNPAASGVLTDGSFRISSEGHGELLDIGVTGAGTWLQSRLSTEYATTYKLLLNPNGGNVGIGTTSPSDKFHVYNGNSQLTGTGSVWYSSGNQLFKHATSSSSWRMAPCDGTGDGNCPANGFIIHQDSVATRLAITSAGNVGIGITNPGSPLTVAGNAVIYGSAAYSAVDNIGAAAWSSGIKTWDMHASGTVSSPNPFSQTSDRRLKTEIEAIPHALEKLRRIKGVSYYWRDQDLYGSRKQLGVIAQDVEAVFPEAVTTNQNGIKNVGYTALIGPVIEGIKELYDKWMLHDSRLEKIEAELRLAQLRATREIASMKAATEAADARAKLAEQKYADLEARLERIEYIPSRKP